MFLLQYPINHEYEHTQIDTAQFQYIYHQVFIIRFRYF